MRGSLVLHRSTISSGIIVDPRSPNLAAERGTTTGFNTGHLGICVPALGGSHQFGYKRLSVCHSDNIETQLLLHV